MDSFNTPSLQNQRLNDSIQHQTSVDFSNNSTLQYDNMNSGNFTTIDEPNPSCVSFLTCVVGIPGNLLVIAVYAWKMTTSTRVYMFALAVSDLMVCICGIVLATLKFDYISLGITMYSVHTALTFSALLLAFISIERLLAVRRPHTFSLSSLRAKRALMGIAFAAVVCTMVETVARVKRYRLLLLVVPAVVTVTSVVTMIICYSLMAITMLMNVRYSYRNVGVSSSTPAPGPPTVPTVTYLIPNGKARVDVTSSTNTALSRIPKTNAKQANTYKRVSVLFINTVVFLICLLPLWLNSVGLHVPPDVQRMFLLNSVVNPFLYSVVSRMFREDVRQFYGQMRSRLASCNC